MSIDERKRVLSIILEEVNGRVPVMPHVGQDARSSSWGQA
jgi:dihydrodipicolinate synthase/N-acetylneuraminate lyase